MASFDANRFLNQLIAKLDDLPSVSEYKNKGTHQNRKKIDQIVQRLEKFKEDLDPVKHTRIHDPSNPMVAAFHLASDLERAERVPFPDIQAFWGSGIYAIYYGGDHPAYDVISERDFPIYIGKADPADFTATTSVEQGKKLYDRIREHRSSIEESEEYVGSMEPSELKDKGLHQIKSEDFTCAYLVVPSAFAAATETVLINHYAPVWNKETNVCQGLGKHGDSATTRTNTRSQWDTIHPGRAWSIGGSNVDRDESPLDIQNSILEYCRSRYPDK